MRRRVLVSLALLALGATLAAAPASAQRQAYRACPTFQQAVEVQGHRPR
jgi:hypothetical protein